MTSSENVWFSYEFKTNKSPEASQVSVYSRAFKEMNMPAYSFKINDNGIEEVTYRSVTPAIGRIESSRKKRVFDGLTFATIDKNKKLKGYRGIQRNAIYHLGFLANTFEQAAECCADNYCPKNINNPSAVKFQPQILTKSEFYEAYPDAPKGAFVPIDTSGYAKAKTELDVPRVRAPARAQ